MPRRGREKGRVKIQFIMDDEKRKTTLKRRLPALKKKAGELAGLCDVPVCLVAYPPGEDRPVVWPSPGAAADVVGQYRGLPHLERFRNKLDSTDFVKQMNDKVSAKLSKVQLQTRQAEIKTVIADFAAGRRGSFDDLPIDLFVSVGMNVQDKLQAINARLDEIRSAPPPPPVPEDRQMVEPLPMVSTPVPKKNDVVMTPLMKPETPPPQQDPMTLDGEPRHGSYLFEVLDALNDPGDGSALPSAEEMQAVFLHAGIFSPQLPNPSFSP
jgi:hypothetical protein